MRSRLAQRPSWLIFAAALVVRLAYLGFVEQPPVQFDARLYASASVAAPYALFHPSLWNDREWQALLRFPDLVRDAVKDETIIWHPYKVLSFPEALDALYYSGPVLPFLYGSVIYAAPRYDFWCVRILLALIDSLSAVLVWALMRRLVSPRGAIIGATLWVVYFPAIVRTGELVTEIPAICLCLAMVYSLVRAHESGRRGWLELAGLFCGLLALTKASTALLIIPIVVAWLVANRMRWRSAWSGALIIAGFWLVVMAPWFMLVYQRYGSVNVRDPSYGTSSFRQANILATEGYLTDAAPADYWTYPVWREIRSHPLAYAGLYIQKFRRLWWHGSDDYWRAPGKWQSVVQWLHRLVVLFGLCGVLLWRSRAGPAAWFALAIILYFAVLHTIMHVVSRYNLVAMPFVAGAAALAGLWIINDEKPGAIKRALWVALWIAATVILLALIRPVNWMALGFSHTVAVWSFWVGSCLLIGMGTWRIVATRGRQTREALWLAPIVATVVCVAYLGWTVPREGHAEWVTRVDSPAMTITRTIEIPPIPDSVDRAWVYVDCNLEPNSKFDIQISVDSSVAQFRENLISRDSRYNKPNYELMQLVTNDKQWYMRNWSRHVLYGSQLDSILEDSRITVKISIDVTRAQQGALLVYGDLPHNDPRNRDLPGVTYASVERYFEGGDPRIWETIPFEDSRSRSALVVNGERDTVDLSPSWGRQSGEYRIVFVILLSDGRKLYY